MTPQPPFWIQQSNIHPCQCYRCKKTIFPAEQYWRYTYNPDGVDAMGKDFCGYCKEQLKKDVP